MQVGEEGWSEAHFETDFGSGPADGAAEASTSAPAREQPLVPSLSLQEIDAAIDREMGDLKVRLIHVYMRTIYRSVTPGMRTLFYGGWVVVDGERCMVHALHRNALFMANAGIGLNSRRERTGRSHRCAIHSRDRGRREAGRQQVWHLESLFDMTVVTIIVAASACRAPEQACVHADHRGRLGMAMG